jgi:peptide deformylase
MSRLPLRFYGDPILRTRCLPIESITDEIKQLVQDMIETMDADKGCGLAAPQVGHSLRVFVLRDYVETPQGDVVLSEPRVYINPKLSNPSLKKVLDTEGCLSIPGIRAELERPIKIRIEAIDLEGRSFVEEVEGYNARIRMHENDHINGVLYIDRLNLRRRKKVEPLLQELQKKYQRGL